MRRGRMEPRGWDKRETVGRGDGCRSFDGCFSGPTAPAGAGGHWTLATRGRCRPWDRHAETPLLEAATTTLTTAEAIAISTLYKVDEPTQQALLSCAAADQAAAAALEPVPGPLDHWALLDVLHLVTTGRRTGRRLTRAWPLFAVDASRVLLLAPAGPADWLANIKKQPEVGIGPPGAPRQGLAVEPLADTPESRRQRWLVMRRLGQPPELENGRLVVIDVSQDMTLVDW